MFSLKERRKIRDALEKRVGLGARMLELAPSDRAKMRRDVRKVCQNADAFDSFVEQKAKELRKGSANKLKADGEILKILLDWISNGGLDVIWAFIQKIITAV